MDQNFRQDINKAARDENNEKKCIGIPDRKSKDTNGTYKPIRRKKITVTSKEKGQKTDNNIQNKT